MYIYNVTTKVHTSIENDWLQWLQEEHIPEIIETGCFTSTSILQLLETDDTEGPTFAVQYKAESKGLYNQYMEKFAGTMRQRSFDKWGDKVIAFRSLMQVIS